MLIRMGLISSQHTGAVPGRSAMDLACSPVHKIEKALADGKIFSFLTVDAKGAYDALLRRQLLRRMRTLGLSARLINLVDNFLSDRWIRIPFEGHITNKRRVLCGTPQGSPLSRVLYVVYLLELLLQTDLRFGYANDVGFYAISNSIDTNAQLLSKHLKKVL